MHKFRIFFNIAVILIFILIAVFSFLPTVPEVPSVEHLDKILHFLAYCALSFFIVMAAQKKSRLVMLIALAIFYGILVEFIQYYIPGRDKSFYDFVADFLGVVCGFLVAVWLKPIVMKSLERLTKGDL